MSMSAAVSLSFPTTADVTHVVRNTSTDPTQFRGMEVLGDSAEFVTDIQVDVIEETRGIAGPRSLGGSFNRPKLSGNTIRKYATAYWGDTYTINEKELLEARQEGTFNQRAGYNRVIRRSNELNVRLDTLKEKLRWDSLAVGLIQAKNNGVNFQVSYDIPDSHKKSYQLLTDPKFDVTDMLSDIQTTYRGTGGKADKMWFNSILANALAKNAVIRDLLKQSNFALALTAANIPSILEKLFPQMKFEVYDEGYKNEAGVFVPFIPDDGFVVTGKGPEKLGDFCSTLAIQNGGVNDPKPGKFALIEDKSAESVPYIDITVGENGLPRHHHPEWIIRATIS